MACLLCRFIRTFLPSPSEERRHAFWMYVYDWEADFGRDWEPRHEDESVRERAAVVATLLKKDPKAAIEELSDLAELGAAWPARVLGHFYRDGDVVEQDLRLAEAYFYKAHEVGSWMGSLDMARLLFRYSINENWKVLLENGDRAGFIPSTFWLAWYSSGQSPTLSNARRVRPLLEKAAEAGHPRARYMLAAWKLNGKFGLREIPQGAREGGLVMQQFVNRELPSNET